MPKHHPAARRPGLRTLVPATTTALALALAGCAGSDPDPVAATTSRNTTAAPTTSSPSTNASPSSTATSTSAPPPPTTSPPRTATVTPTPTVRPAPAPVTSLPPVPAAAPEPAARFPANPPATGTGARALVVAVPDVVWNRMVGYSWTEGCPVGRSSLRYVAVNFWGFDGKRSRGGLVVHRDIATDTAAAFTTLYAQQFRIRQMRPMDSSWGHNPKGPGADDYAAMEADNTSAFNCRYVGGMESTKRYSNHAYGKAIDVNDWENPYVAEDGRIYPNRTFLDRSARPGVFPSAGSAPVRAFTDEGFTWGGLWNDPDYQHFDG